MLQLTQDEWNNWVEHQTYRSRSKKYPEREKKIIELSKKGVSPKTILKIVGGQPGHIGEVRMKARREGLY